MVESLVRANGVGFVGEGRRGGGGDVGVWPIKMDAGGNPLVRFAGFGPGWIGLARRHARNRLHELRFRVWVCANAFSCNGVLRANCQVACPIWRDFTPQACPGVTETQSHQWDNCRWQQKNKVGRTR